MGFSGGFQTSKGGAKNINKNYTGSLYPCVVLLCAIDEHREQLTYLYIR